MNIKLEKYFIPNEDASYIAKNGERYLVAAVNFRGEKTKRAEMAYEQIKLQSVPVSQTILHVNNFLDALKDEVENKLDINTIELDGIKHGVIGNCIVVKGCDWKKIRWKEAAYDIKYDVIKEKFRLYNPWDIIWLKFTVIPNSKHQFLGVVALSNDINFSYDNSAGKLVTEVGQSWDESFVCIFPLTKEILNNKNRREIETGVGNYLIEKAVPIIDYYSHNNFRM